MSDILLTDEEEKSQGLIVTLFVDSLPSGGAEPDETESSSGEVDTTLTPCMQCLRGSLFKYTHSVNSMLKTGLVHQPDLWVCHA